MKKIPSLFKRNYDGDRLAYNEIVEGSEWVIWGEGQATVKYDGTCCMIRNRKLYKRYDRKLKKDVARNLTINQVPTEEHYKDAPKGWEAAEETPDVHTGHWPGWVPVKTDEPSDKWHLEALNNPVVGGYQDGTYELIGPKVQGNPYGLEKHLLVRHGRDIIHDNPRTFAGGYRFKTVRSLFNTATFIEEVP